MQSVLDPWLTAARVQAARQAQRRRIVIHDTDSDESDSTTPSNGVALPPCPALIDDSEDVTVSTALPDATPSNGGFALPPCPALIDDSDDSIEDDTVSTALPDAPLDLLNLWKSVPKTPCQFLDLSAQHNSDKGDRDSLCDSDSSALSEGFIDDSDAALHQKNMSFMRKMSEVLPITLKAMKRQERVRNVMRRQEAVDGKVVTPVSSIEVGR
jgi:hypothetical protein